TGTACDTPETTVGNRRSHRAIATLEFSVRFSNLPGERLFPRIRPGMGRVRQAVWRVARHERVVQGIRHISVALHVASGSTIFREVAGPATHPDFLCPVA